MNKNKKLNFWDIVKMIHPDMNPDIKNPSEKMEYATKLKDNPKELYILAVKWGLIEDNSIEKVDINYTIGIGKIIKINKTDEGVIIDIINKKDHIEVIVFINNKFQKYIKRDINDQYENFYILGFADPDVFEKLDYQYQMKYIPRQDGKSDPRIKDIGNIVESG